MDVTTKPNPLKRRISLPTPNMEENPFVMDTVTTPSEDNRSHHLPHDTAWEYKPEIADEDTLPGQPSLSHSYCLEWETLFTKPDKMKKLKGKAIEGNLRSSRFRSVAWKLFLEVLPADMSTWIEQTRKTRKNYEDMKNRLIVNPRKAVDCADIMLNNPLSQAEESPWNKFFQDNELRLTIKQDVIRTYPKIEFFQSNQLRNLMVDILFIYAKENPDISYQQGMHELLAPLIFVLHCDHQAFLHACEIDSSICSQESVMRAVLDPAYLEHDAYAMFCHVMETVEPWYLSRDVFNNQSKTGSSRSLELVTAAPFSKSQDLNPSSAIVKKLTRIQDGILKSIDPDLHQHLELLDIVPQIYGIRWLRLLFGREFPMQDLLMLWDAIFGDSSTFDLVDYIFVAMLLYLRDILLTNDYTICLTVLMKFPPVPDVHYFVAKGLWIRAPDMYAPLPNYTHQGSIRVTGSMGSSVENIGSVASDGGSKDLGRSHHRHHTHKQQNSMFGGFSSFSRKFSRPQTLSVPKSSSEPMNLQTDISPNHADNPKGSTVSLSHVDESMFRHTTLASSLAHLEGSNLRSAQSSPGVHHSAMFPLTPDDMSITSSPPKYNSLSGKSGHQLQISRREQELQEKVAILQKELSDKKSLCRYCSSKLDVHIVRLQQDIPRQNSQIDDDIMMSLAGLKLVRDILNGTITFSQDVTAEDDDIQMNYDFDRSQDKGGSNCSTNVTSPDSDILLNTVPCEESILKIPAQQRVVYSYKTGEDINSPDSSCHEPTRNFDTKIFESKVIELHDFQSFDRKVKAGYSPTNATVREQKLPADKDINFDISRRVIPSPGDNKYFPDHSTPKNIQNISAIKNTPSSTYSKTISSSADVKKVSSPTETKSILSSVVNKNSLTSGSNKNMLTSATNKNVSTSGNFTSKFLRMFKIESSSSGDTHSSSTNQAIPGQQNVSGSSGVASLLPRIFSDD